MEKGLLFGMVIAVVVGLTRYLQQRRGTSRVLRALPGGTGKARVALDEWQPPIQGKVSAGRLHEYLERVAWLAIIGEHDELEQEAAGLDGSLSVVTQLRAMALAGLVAFRDEPRDLAGIEEVARRIEEEGGALLGLLKRTVGDVRSLARTVCGQQVLDGEALRRVQNRAKQSGPAQKVVLGRLCQRAGEGAGDDVGDSRAAGR